MKPKRILSALVSLLMAGNAVIGSVPVSALTSSAADSESSDPQNAVQGSILFEAEEETAAEESPQEPEASGSPEETLSEYTVSDACGPNATWNYDPDTHALLIRGTGEIRDLTYRSDMWFDYCKEVEEIVVEDGITLIPDGVFQDCAAVQKLTLPYFTSPDAQETEKTPVFSALFGRSVPATLTTVVVTGDSEIPAGYFSSCQNLTEIVLPETLETIGNEAFKDCDALTAVTIPEHVTLIGSYAFSSCDVLSSVTFPAELQEIGSYAFSSDKALTAVELPDSLERIGSCAFQYDSGLTEIVIPANVQEIGTNVLNGASALTTITLPFAGTPESAKEGTTRTFTDLFYGTLPEGLTTVTVTGGTQIGTRYFRNCAKLTAITLPDTIQTIDTAAFSGCTGLTELTLPGSLQVIGESAFEGCTGLAELSVPKSVTEIGTAAFQSCTGLTKLTLSDGLHSIGEHAFAKCSGMKAFSLPSSLRSIGGYAFEGCTELKSFVIPEGVTELGASILNGDEALTSVTLPSADFDLSASSIINGSKALPETLTTLHISGGTKIAPSFFSGCTTLTEITLPDTLAEIGTMAFKGCTALAELTIPDSVYAVGKNAFADTAWYEAQDNGIVYAGQVVLGVKGRTVEEKLSFRDGTTGIADHAFYASNVTAVTFPETLQCIGSYAFYDCDKLTSVNIPDAVHTLGSYAFAACSSLKDVTVPDTVTNIGEAPLDGTGWLSAQADGPVYVGTTFYGYKGTMPHNTTLTLREDCTVIRAGALIGQEDLVGIVLPDGLTSIGAQAFKNCQFLESVTIPDSVTVIGEEAFLGCKKLTAAVLPDGLQTVPAGLFKGCENLETMVIPESVTAIRDEAFYNCPALHDLTVPGTVGKISTGAFGLDRSQADYRSESFRLTFSDGTKEVLSTATTAFADITTEVVFPDSVTALGENAFRGFVKLTELTLPKGLKSIGNAGFRDCTGLRSLTIPSGVTLLPDDALNGCTALTAVTLPKKLTAVGKRAFYSCSALPRITIPDTVTAIGSGAFQYCEALAAVTLPASLKTIGDYAFQKTALTAAALPYGTEEIGDQAFFDCFSLANITLPDTLTSISSNVFGYGYSTDKSLIPERVLTVADGSKTITSVMTKALGSTLTGVVFAESMTEVGEMAFNGCERLTELTLPDTVKSIGKYAFGDCTALTTLKLPAALQTIPENMASGCTSLRAVSLPEKVTGIGSYAFKGCNALQGIVIPDSVQTLGKGILQECTALKSAVLPDGIQAIPSNMFSGCVLLKSITIPESVTSIGENAFYDCLALAQVHMYDYVTSFGSQAFGYRRDAVPAGRTLTLEEGSVRIEPALIKAMNSSMTAIVLPESLVKIDDYAFRDCTALNVIRIPENVTSIGEGAFSGCTELTELTIPDGVDRLSARMFRGCTNLREVTLPDSITVIPEYAFENCENLSVINLAQEHVKFYGTSFRGCYALYDMRFNVIDRRNVNFSANQGELSADGIANMTLQYKLNTDLTEGDAYTIQLDIPKGAVLLYNSLIGAEDIQIRGSRYILKTPEASGKIQLAVKLEEYGTFRLAAALGFRFNGEDYAEPIGAVDLKAPEVSLSVPQNVNSSSLAVRGVAVPGENVTIFANGEEVGTATANAKTGSYAATITIPEVEEGTDVMIRASVQDYTSEEVAVTYAPGKPMVERVLFGFNGREQKMDITSVFTEGKQPAISFNPRYPFEFEIETSSPERVAAVYMTSTKGDEIRKLRAYWIPESAVWSAYGYFEPENHSYVPGTLNIEIVETEPAVIDLTDGTISAPQSMLDEIFDETGTEKNTLEALQENLLPESIEQNSKTKITYESDTATMADISVSNGKQEEKISTFVEKADSFCIDGKYVPIGDIVKNPGAYGFEKTPVTVRGDSDQYDYYVRPVDGDDCFGQVIENYKHNDSSGLAYTEEQLRNAANYSQGVGGYLIEIGRKIGEVYEDPEVNGFASIATGAGDLFLNNSFSFSWDNVTQNWKGTMTDLDGGKLGAGFKAVGTAMNIIDTAASTVHYGKQMLDASGNTRLQVEATGLYALRMGVTWLGGDLGAKAGLAVGTALGGPLGGVVGAFVGGVIVPYACGKLLDIWDENLSERIEAYRGGGQLKWLIDPSGYVFEAVTSNRLAGAKLTVYYKDPETGKEIEWNADDFDQKNPLYSNENGEYAWDVPEGKWRVKFEMEGYETYETDWMDVPPLQNNVNINAVSLSEPEIAGTLLADNSIIVNFSKYMDILTVTPATVSLYAGADQVECRVLPSLTSEEDAYAMTYVIEPAEGKLPDGDLTLVFKEGCKSYSGQPLPEQIAVVEHPEVIGALTPEKPMLIISKDTEGEMTVNAVPASLAAGKKLTVKDPQGIISVTKAGVFDKNGAATVKFEMQRTGLTVLEFGVEGDEITANATLIVVTPEEINAIEQETTTTTQATTTTTTTTTKPVTTTTTTTTKPVTTTTTTTKPVTTTTTTTKPVTTTTTTTKPVTTTTTTTKPVTTTTTTTKPVTTTTTTTKPVTTTTTTTKPVTTTTTTTSQATTTTTTTSTQATTTTTTTTQTTTTTTTTETTTTTTTETTTTTTTTETTTTQTESSTTESQTQQPGEGDDFLAALKTNERVFYFSHDPNAFDPAELLTADETEGLPYDRFSFGLTADGADEGLSPQQVSGNADEGLRKTLYVYYRDTLVKTAEGEPLTAEIFLGVKGDTDLNGAVNAADAANVLLYAAAKGAGEDAVICSDTDDALEQYAFFLADVDTESREGATDAATLNATDAASILIFAALTGAMGVDENGESFARWIDETDPENGVLSAPYPETSEAIARANALLLQ